MCPVPASGQGLWPVSLERSEHTPTREAPAGVVCAKRTKQHRNSIVVAVPARFLAHDVVEVRVDGLHQAGEAHCLDDLLHAPLAAPEFLSNGGRADAIGHELDHCLLEVLDGWPPSHGARAEFFESCTHEFPSQEVFGESCFGIAPI
jgi:hypothetical protein